METIVNYPIGAEATRLLLEPVYRMQWERYMRNIVLPEYLERIGLQHLIQ